MKPLALFTLFLAAPALAQNSDPARLTHPIVESLSELTLPDELRPLAMAFATAEDPAFFERSPSVSVITMELARMHKPSRESTKTIRIGLGVVLGQSLSHDQILMAYMQDIHLGRGCYGIDAASIALFDKAPETLGIRDRAILASLPRSPQAIHRPDRWLKRTNSVLTEMQKTGLISTQDAQTAALKAVSELPEGKSCSDNTDK